MSEVINMPISEIFIDEDFNSRGKILPMDVIDLAKDIDRVGLIQPVTVMPCSLDETQKTGKKYKLLAGFRRTHAHIVLQRETIPVLIHARLSDSDATIFNLSENLNRADLSIVQEARAMRRLSSYAFSEELIAEKIGKSRGWVQVRMMLLQLPEEVQREVEAGFIGQTHIRELFSVYRHSGQEAVFTAVKQIKDAKLKGQKRVIVDPNKLHKDCRRVRLRPEILDMLSYVIDLTGSGLHTRCLAWCAGEISNNEFFETIKKWCEDNNKVFTLPV